MILPILNDTPKIIHSTKKDDNFLINIHSLSKSTFIPNKDLDILDKTRSNQLPWKGQFSPQLVESFLKYFVRKTTHTILDPFLGSGTVILESSKFKLTSFGTELNPAAYHLSLIYNLINVKNREQLLKSVEQKILSISNLTHNLFNSSTEVFDLQNEIIKLAKSKNLDEQEKIIVNAYIVLLDFFNNSVTSQHLLKVWFRLKKIISDLPSSEEEIQIFNCDARKVPIPSHTIDLIITSPPYINVFNYHQQYRRSVESLGWNLLHVAKSEIGSNRKYRSNRFLIVVQYILDMYCVFHELKRVTKKNADIILVIGRESNVRKTPFLNSEIICSLGILTGFDKPTWQERKYTNRFGKTIYEDILYFNGSKDYEFNESICRKLANEVLNKAINFAPESSMEDLKEAIRLSDSVIYSELYKEQTNENF